MLADDYLSEDQLSTFRLVLEDQLEVLMSQSRQAVSSLTAVRDMDGDILDYATSETSRDVTLRLADRERQLVGRIRHALVRMDNGEYGTCESCGGPIASRRLLARPVASQCIDCQTEAEQIQPRTPTF